MLAQQLERPFRVPTQRFGADELFSLLHVGPLCVALQPFEATQPGRRMPDDGCQQAAGRHDDERQAKGLVEPADAFADVPHDAEHDDADQAGRKNAARQHAGGAIVGHEQLEAAMGLRCGGSCREQQHHD